MAVSGLKPPTLTATQNLCTWRCGLLTQNTCDVSVVSIPHTGTHFINDLLKANGFQPRAVMHIVPANLEQIKTLPNIIIPLRPPMRVAKSWAKRQRQDRWEWMWSVVGGLGDHYFFVEEDRAREHERLQAFLGKPIHIDWTPKNHSDDPIGAPTQTPGEIRRAEATYRELRDVHIQGLSDQPDQAVQGRN